MHRLGSFPQIELIKTPDSPTASMRSTPDLSDSDLDIYETPKTTSLQTELQAGLELHKPEATPSGFSNSYFLRNSAGKKVGVFKPMNMEPGAPKNTRMTERGTPNVAILQTIQPGQSAGNEVLLYALDQALGHRYGVPKTELVRLKHPEFQGEELGSVQDFLPNMQSLSSIDDKKLLALPRDQMDRFNIKLISGGTDGHFDNFLYDPIEDELGLIDGGLDFVGAADHDRLLGHAWVNLPLASEAMSNEEYTALKNIDVDSVMSHIQNQAQKNASIDPKLHVETDKLLGLKMRLELAKAIGEHQLTQMQWFTLLADPQYNPNGGFIETYNKHAAQFGPESKFDEANSQIDWTTVRKELNDAAKKIKDAT